MSDWRGTIARWRQLPLAEKMRIRRNAVVEETIGSMAMADEPVSAQWANEARQNDLIRRIQEDPDAYFESVRSRAARLEYIEKLRSMHPDQILSDRLDCIERNL